MTHLSSLQPLLNVHLMKHTVSYLYALADCPSTIAHKSLLLENFYSVFKTYFKCPIWEVSHFWFVSSPDSDVQFHIHAAITVPSNCTAVILHICLPYKTASSWEARAKSQTLVWAPRALSNSLLNAGCWLHGCPRVFNDCEQVP